MTVFIFTGPTLPPADARGELDAVYLPPASQGDVYRAALARPRAIGLIDGFFDYVPSVWHKEILWAMSRGVAVFGSASMGALRAAELAPFGMRGVGKIFQAYRSGAIEDDDEVALLHGPAETGFRPTSEAMVNIRPTLQRAQSRRVISRKTRLKLESLAKGLFYPERTYAAILDLAAGRGLPARELEKLRAWLPAGRVDQKRADAVAMLRAMREFLAARGSQARPRHPFEHTKFWDRLVRSAGALHAVENGAREMVPFESVLDELRLEPDTFLEMHREGLLRQLILAEARRHGYAPAPAACARTARFFRRLYRIERRAAFDRWLAQRGLTARRFDEWMAEEALIRAVGPELWLDVRRGLPELLRFTPFYPRLLNRAREKQLALSRAGLDAADPAAEPDALWRSFLEEASADDHPFESESVLQKISPEESESLLRARAREHRFRRLRKSRRP